MSRRKRPTALDVSFADDLAPATSQNGTKKRKPEAEVTFLGYEVWKYSNTEREQPESIDMHFDPSYETPSRVDLC